ncbi:MAG: M6 family metalloprotease domain-containing protein [Paludibacteraceae bacterium]
MNIFKSVFLPVLLFFCVFHTQAVPAYPYPVTIAQPDGTTLTVVLKGDEFHRYHTTEDGYFITKDNSGVFNYARMESSGRLISTGVKASDAARRTTAERNFVAGLSHATIPAAVNKMMRSKGAKPAAVSATPARFPGQGSPRSLVILVKFKDLDFVTPNPQAAFTDLLNQQGYSANGATGSARDYFRDNSMGTFTPQFDVVGPFDLPNNYKYYGENDANGDDKNAVQMIVDACAKADSAGVDFSIYDTDGDGLVDNVFVYYAGHNEAEWASENTVWPHRWSIYRGFNYSGSEASITFDGKRIMDYACTSELKWDEGTSMAGIGTFTHEFGHVLGLADMYATDGATHQTLSYWNIMDAGAYLNEGRTPPAYNAFERFQLGFLTPELLQNNSVNVSLDTLLSSNKAYLISSTETHNLNFNDPTPAEFFLLENRQNKGWDKFLPGHGMLLYRIFYNETDWYNNEPNNDPDAMGVDILEADVIASDATLAGDPFPGTSGVTSFDLISRAGTPFNKEIRGVAENNGKITFSILTPLGIPVVPTDASTITVNGTGFNAAWNPVTGANSYLVDVYTKTEGGGIQTILSENFVKFTKGQPNGGADATEISSSLNDYTGVTGWTGAKVFQAGGSAKIGSSSNLGYLVTPALNLSADGGNFTLQFDATAWKGDDKSLKIFVNGQQVHTVTDLDNSAYTFKTYTLPLTGGNASTVIRFEGNKASKGRFMLDNVLVTQGTGGVKIPVLNSPFSATGTSYQVSNLESGKSYYYSVRAVNEWQTSALSGEVGPITLVITGTENVHSDRLHVWMNEGALCFYSNEGENVEVFNLSGQKMLISKTSEGLNILPVQISGVLIVKVGNRVGKVIVP